MQRNPQALFLFIVVAMIFILLASGNVAAKEEKYRRLDLHTNQPADTEYLTYKLSYSGLITGFVWKDLADVSFHYQSGEMQFQGVKTCEGVLRLTTENHSFAELFHPVRYEWISLTDPDLNRTYLVEEIDQGQSDNHRIVWLDWDEEKFRFYRKRELKPVEKEQVWYFDEDPEVVYKWDGDGRETVPGFLDRYPPVNEGKLSYLIHDKTENGLDVESAIDPLSLVYRLRQHDFEAEKHMDLVLTLDDEVGDYRVSFVNKEVIHIDFTPVNALVVQVSRTDKSEAEKEGWVRIWYSDDELRVPLNFQAEAPVGKMRVKITEQSLKQALKQEQPTACLATP